MDVHQNYSEPWSVTLIDTGEDTMTGGRLRRASRYLENEEARLIEAREGYGLARAWEAWKRKVEIK